MAASRNAKVQVSKDGPYLVSGSVPLIREEAVRGKDGAPFEWRKVAELPEQEHYALCRCGATKDAPYCDSSHLAIRFDGTETAERHRHEPKLVVGPGVNMDGVAAPCARAQFCQRGGGIWKLVPRSDDPAKNLALHKPANQSSLSVWSASKLVAPKAVESAPLPVNDAIRRGRLLAADLQAAGLDTAPFEHELDAVAAKLENASEPLADDARRHLYFSARRIVRRLAFANPLLQFDQLLFVKRFTQQTYPDICLNHMPWVSRPGGAASDEMESADRGARHRTGRYRGRTSRLGRFDGGGQRVTAPADQ